MAVRTKVIAGPNGSQTVELTAEENAARDIEEQAWADGATARTMDAIRQKRDAALAATDWAALPDSPTMSNAMTTYRTALRDYPATYASDNSADFPELGE
tara:strand:- start:27 stop:326 length:300 start_codon:yes stop_codon:yes gene_type:complete